MPIQTCMGSQMKCTFGMAPSVLMPTPKTVTTSNRMAANIMDHIPIMNIQPFGMCQSPSNPAVAAATAAAMGALTPMPCVPATPSPWVAGAVTVMLCNSPALDNVSTLNCIWGGMIMITDPAQATHMIP